MRVIYVIEVENIPKNGQVVVVAYFKEHKKYSTRTNIQNESRRLLLKKIPEFGKEANIEFKPLLFGILRHVEGGVSRSVGVIYSFAYRNMSPEKYSTFHRTLKGNFDQKLAQVANMWSHYDVMIAVGVGGV